MPGNIGYVVMGKLASIFVPEPVTAFLAVNIGLTVVGVAFCYLFSSLIVPRGLAAAAAFAMSCNPIVWYHGGIIASYPVWLAVLPAIGWFGVRYKRAGRFEDLIGASVSLGVGMILRPDLLVFGAPLWFGCLVLGRAPWRHWLIGGSIGWRPAAAGSSARPGSSAGSMSISNGSGEARVRQDLLRALPGGLEGLAERGEVRALPRLGGVGSR